MSNKEGNLLGSCFYCLLQSLVLVVSSCPSWLLLRKEGVFIVGGI